MHSPNLTIKKHPPEYKIHKYKSFTHSHLITSSRRAVQRNYKFEYAVAAIIWAPIFNDSWWWKIASVRLTGIEIKFNVNDGICVRHGMREKEGGGEGWSKQYQVSGATIANQWFRKNVIFKRCSLSSINEILNEFTHRYCHFNKLLWISKKLHSNVKNHMTPAHQLILLAAPFFVEPFENFNCMLQKCD